ncbi:MAG: hypothetical protein CMK59_14205 [Proteobacteria bacterium]|nr:hypothetical protein [Pseudomonadota bacterium]
MSNEFWSWFVRKVCSKQRITLPNVGTFSVVFSKQKSILDICEMWGNDCPTINAVTIPRKVYVRFRPTGNLKLSIKNSSQPKRCYTGDRDPVVSAARWGPYVRKTKNTSNLSQHRKLIWWYHQENQISLIQAAKIVGTQLQFMGKELSLQGRVNLGNGMFIHIIRGKKNVYQHSNNPNRWRARFSIPQEDIIQSISSLNIQ